MEAGSENGIMVHSVLASGWKRLETSFEFLEKEGGAYALLERSEICFGQRCP
jgi:hypothetical protein